MAFTPNEDPDDTAALCAEVERWKGQYDVAVAGHNATIRERDDLRAKLAEDKRIAELERELAVKSEMFDDRNRQVHMMLAERDANAKAARELDEVLGLLRDLEPGWVTQDPPARKRLRELLHLDQPAPRPAEKPAETDVAEDVLGSVEEGLGGTP